MYNPRLPAKLSTSRVSFRLCSEEQHDCKEEQPKDNSIVSVEANEAIESSTKNKPEVEDPQVEKSDDMERENGKENLAQDKMLEVVEDVVQEVNHSV